MNDVDCFWPKVEKQAGCWIWRGAVKDTGYGAFRSDGKTVRAHRFAWEQLRGPIPKGAELCHHCDVRHCVNPDHLYVGTKSSNMFDMWRRGRGNKPPMRGEKNGNCRLSDAAVADLRAQRAAGATFKQLAERFDCSTSTAHQICSGRTRTA